MISAVLLSPSLASPLPDPRAAEAVARSLGALVRATMEGVVRDALLIGPAVDGLALLADHAGCENIESATTRDGLRRAFAEARGEIVFVLQGGFAPPSGFIEEASDLLLEGAGFAGALLRAAPHNLPTRLAPDLARAVGLLARRTQAAATEARDLHDLIRQIKPRRTLNSRAVRTL
jgi:hypothetical protein